MKRAALLLAALVSACGSASSPLPATAPTLAPAAGTSLYLAWLSHPEPEVTYRVYSTARLSDPGVLELETVDTSAVIPGFQRDVPCYYLTAVNPDGEGQRTAGACI